MTKRVLIADDHRLVREKVRNLLSTCNDIEICGEAANGVDAVEMAQKLRPDVVVLDLSMPKMNGFAVATALLDEQPNVRVILLSEYKDAISDEQLRTAGIAVCLSKSEAWERLVEEVQQS
jgi:DNA-binding NarL/FixJ family response regulator